MQGAATLEEVAPVAVRGQSLQMRIVRQVLRKKLAVIALVYLAIFYFCGIFAPLIAPYDPNEQRIGARILANGQREPSEVLQGPSADHPFGTDTLGRDMLSRVFYASRTTIIFTLAVTLTGGLFLGLGLGLLAGYRGGWIDTLIMRVGEVLNGLPTLFILLAITASFRTQIDDWSFTLRENTFLGNEARTFLQFAIIVGATVPFSWVGSTRIVRSQALAIREADFVVAAELLGASTWRVLTRHILPGVMPLFLVGLSAGMASIAGAEVTLSFLGLGISPPTASFGNMISDGAGVRAFQAHPHVLFAASGPVILFFFAWNLLGDALVDILDPRLIDR